MLPLAVGAFLLLVALALFVFADRRGSDHHGGEASANTPPASDYHGPKQFTVTCSPEFPQWCVNFTPTAGDPGPLQPVTIPSANGRKWSDCQTPGKRVCVVPVGLVEGALLDQILASFQEKYRLNILVGPSINLPQGALSGGRDSDRHLRQVDAGVIVEYMLLLQQQAGIRNQAVDGLTLIGITSADIYLANSPQFRFVFGQRFEYDLGDQISAHAGVVSYYRMDDGLRGRETRIVSRAEKMMSKYIGLYYFNLPGSRDPYSAMYDAIGSVADLDRMSDTLPIAHH
jgi:hypothetical protein